MGSSSRGGHDICKDQIRVAMLFVKLFLLNNHQKMIGHTAPSLFHSLVAESHIFQIIWSRGKLKKTVGLTLGTHKSSLLASKKNHCNAFKFDATSD
jgi:hypothetical protein